MHFWNNTKNTSCSIAFYMMGYRCYLLEGPRCAKAGAVGMQQTQGVLVSPGGCHQLVWLCRMMLVHGTHEAYDGRLDVPMLSQQLGCLAVVLQGIIQVECKLQTDLQHAYIIV